MATIDEIAKLAKVSKTTVSFVLNSKPGVSKATADHVRKVMAELNYVPSALAQRFANRRSMAVALIALPYPQVFSNSHHADVLDAVFSTLDAAGYSLVLGTSSDHFIYEKKYMTLLQSGLIDGMLLLEPTLDQEYLTELAKGDCPVVVVNADGGHVGLEFVRTDDRAVGRMAAEYLLELGHTNIGFIAGSAHHSSARERFAGFRTALADAGHPLEIERIYHGQFEQSAWSGAQGCREILAARPNTTAIFCSNDTMAVSAMSAAREIGRSVPDALSVLGVDDNPICNYTDPPLSTIRQPSYQIAKQAAKVLLKRLNPDEEEGPRHRAEILVAPELIIRDSVAAPPDGETLDSLR